MKKRIIDWLQSEKDYEKGLALYYELAPSPKRVFPGKPTCARCAAMLELELKSLLDVLPDDAEAPKTIVDGFKTVNLDTMAYTELRKYFLEFGYKPANASKVKMIETLKDHQNKL